MSKDEIFRIVINAISSLVASVLIYKIQYRVNRINEDKWKPKKKEKDGNFYMLILMYSGCGTLLVYIAYTILSQYSKLLGIFLVMLSNIGMILLINSRKFVRKRLLANSKNKGKKLLVIDMPIVVMQMYWGIINAYWVLKILCICILAIFEIAGLEMFRGYIKYENSFADIALNTSKVIEKVEVDKIYKSGKWLIIEYEKEKRYVLFESIVDIRYYGEDKYVISKTIIDTWRENKEMKEC